MFLLAFLQMSPFGGVYTIKCPAAWITPSTPAWFQWVTCAEARVMLFEQLAQFSSACSNVHWSEAVVPHGRKKKDAPTPELLAGTEKKKKPGTELQEKQELNSEKWTSGCFS